MIILGIDPGYAIVGYGIIEFKNTKYTPVHHGAILTSPKDNFPQRLSIIFNKLTDIINTYSPDAASIEKLYFQNNHKTAIDVAQARGVTLLTVKNFNTIILDYLHFVLA